MEKDVIYVAKPKKIDILLIFYWSIPFIAIFLFSIIFNQIWVLLWISVIVIVFITFFPREYLILEDRIRIVCNLYKKDILYNDIKYIDECSVSKAMLNSMFRAITFMTSLKEVVYIDRGRGKFLIQISPQDSQRFIEEIKKMKNI